MQFSLTSQPCYPLKIFLRLMLGDSGMWLNLLVWSSNPFMMSKREDEKKAKHTQPQKALIKRIQKLQSTQSAVMNSKWGSTCKELTICLHEVQFLWDSGLSWHDLACRELWTEICTRFILLFYFIREPSLGTDPSDAWKLHLSTIPDQEFLEKVYTAAAKARKWILHSSIYPRIWLTRPISD